MCLITAPPPPPHVHFMLGGWKKTRYWSWCLGGDKEDGRRGGWGRDRRRHGRKQRGRKNCGLNASGALSSRIITSTLLFLFFPLFSLLCLHVSLVLLFSPALPLFLSSFSSLSLTLSLSLSSSHHQLQCRDFRRDPRQAVRWPARRMWHHRPLDRLSALRRCHGNVGNGLRSRGCRRDACRRRRGSRRMRKESLSFSFLKSYICHRCVSSLFSTCRNPQIDWYSRMKGTSKGTATQTHKQMHITHTHWCRGILSKREMSMQQSVFQQQLDVWRCSKERGLSRPPAEGCWQLSASSLLSARLLSAARLQLHTSLSCSYILSVHLQNRRAGPTWSRILLACNASLGSSVSRCRGALDSCLS